MDHFLRGIIEEHGERPALAFVGEKPMTFKEMGVRVERVKRLLRDLGIRRGEHVAILGTSSPNWGIAFLAVTSMGAVAVPILEDFPESDINHILQHSESVAVFISRSLSQSLTLRSIRKNTTIVGLDDFSILARGDRQGGFWKKVLHVFDRNQPREQPVEGGEISEDDLAEIIYTSGTTGHSKGVMLTHGNLVSNVIEGARRVKGLNGQTVTLMILPLAHAFGSTAAFLVVLCGGGSIYFLDRKPSPKIFLAAMQQVRPTILAAVPLVFEKIYHKQVLPALNERIILRWLTKFKLGKNLVYRIIGRRILRQFGGRFTCAVIGGASLSHEVESFLKEARIPIALGYGLTECAPLVSFSSLDEAKMGSVGRAIDGVEIRIAEQDPQSGIGEIHVRGPNVMKGYFKNEEETRKVFAEDGWLITGDLGCIDSDGFLFITGRSKNVIVGPSGENIYPEVIEDLFKDSPFVEEVLVHMSGEHLVARVYPDYAYIEGLKGLEQDGKLASDISTLLERARQEVNAKLLPTSRVQKIFEQREPFAKTPTNKIKRTQYLTGPAEN